jgi:hypothetical protein
MGLEAFVLEGAARTEHTVNPPHSTLQCQTLGY